MLHSLKINGLCHQNHMNMLKVVLTHSCTLVLTIYEQGKRELPDKSPADYRISSTHRGFCDGWCKISCAEICFFFLLSLFHFLQKYPLAVPDLHFMSYIKLLFFYQMPFFSDHLGILMFKILSSYKVKIRFLINYYQQTQSVGLSFWQHGIYGPWPTSCEKKDVWICITKIRRDLHPEVLLEVSQKHNV